MLHFLRKKNVLSKIGVLSLIALIIAVGVSLVDTIWAVYLYSFFHSSVKVGLLSALFTFVSLLSFIFLIPFIEKHDKSKLYQWAVFFSAVGYLLFAFTQSMLVIVLLGVILSILMVIRIDTYGLILRDCSRLDELAKNEGIIFTTLNCGWLVGPLLAAFVADRYGIPLIFMLTAFFLLLSLLTYKSFHVTCRARIKKHIDGDFLKNIRDYFKNKDLVKNYILGGSMTVWWSFIYVYVPLYIIQNGLGVKGVSFFLFAVIIPVVALEYSFARIADSLKYKPLFVAANAILVVLLVAAFFVQNIYVQLFLLICGSIALSMIEAISEAYFFIVAPKKQVEKYYSVHNTYVDVFAITGKLLLAGILALVAFKYTFLALAVVFLFFTLVALTLRKVSAHGEITFEEPGITDIPESI